MSRNAHIKRIAINAAHDLRAHPADNAALNLERVRSYYESALGCRQIECALALNLSIDQVQRAVAKLRSEWNGADQ